MKNEIQDYIKSKDIKYIYALSGVVLLVAFALLSWFLYIAFVVPDTTTISELDITEDIVEEEQCDNFRKLDGICVASERYLNPELVAVMIENNLEAWPLSGLAEASIVYEVPVEGNIPRFMAIYVLDEDVSQVGPVRSARPYYLDWVSEYGNVMYMHVGGSPDALKLIDEYNLFGINEMYRGWYFWRSEYRVAPHSTYTSSDLWRKAYEKYSEYFAEPLGDAQGKEDYDAWKFGVIENCTEDCVSEIDVPIASWNSYHAVWEFNTSTQRYTRFQGGEQMFEMDGEEIFADTVIVQMVKAKVIDAIGRKEIETMGTGDVYIFRNGKVFEGVWTKTSRKDRTRFFDASGDIIPLQAGKVWVEILPIDRDVSWNK
ncbi:MAG: DUF3048 domain-containing protein [bacterium]|nr:DUF3048 domain-containing protein [bacterium]